MRDRLIELIDKADEECKHSKSCEACSGYNKGSMCMNYHIADYLLANGVIVLPELKHKQILYLIYNKTIKPLQVNSYTIRPEFNNLLQIHLYKNGFNGCCTTDDIGKTVFLTKEEAEKALKGGEG